MKQSRVMSMGEAVTNVVVVVSRVWWKSDGGVISG